jgi:hypothetical protein
VPRRQQRRPAFRPRKGEKKSGPEDSGALDASAKRVLFANDSDPQRLESLVRDLQQLRDDADKVAFDDPSPDALREYRRAERELAEAKRALGLAGGA